MRQAIEVAVLAIYLLFSVDADAGKLKPEELRDLLVDSIIVDLQALSDIKEAEKHTDNLVNKIGALIDSYETTSLAQMKVIFRLKELLDENQIKITAQ